MKKVIKRKGNVESFNPNKIKGSLQKATIDAGYTLDEKKDIINEVLANICLLYTSFMANGADVMSPGVVKADINIAEGDTVIIVDENHHKPLAMGIATVSYTHLDVYKRQIQLPPHQKQQFPMLQWWFLHVGLKLEV